MELSEKINISLYNDRMQNSYVKYILYSDKIFFKWLNIVHFYKKHVANGNVNRNIGRDLKIGRQFYIKHMKSLTGYIIK